MDSIPSISVVVPVYNEQGAIHELIVRLRNTLRATGTTHELIIVDDGSTDSSVARMLALKREHPELKILVSEQHQGKAAIMQAGFEAARGKIIVTLDADLQDPPESIPLLLRALDDPEIDFSIGWRNHRHDSAAKRLISKCANALIRLAFGDSLHDMGCNLRAFRREVLSKIRLRDGLHRYFAIIAAHEGFKVKEVVVEHRQRVHGVSKYTTFGRLTGTIFDLSKLFVFGRNFWRPSEHHKSLQLTEANYKN